MSWLDDRVIQYVYTNGIDEVVIEAPVSEEVPLAPKGYKYKGFLPYKLNLVTRVQFVQNGRVGYRIDLGDGKQLYRSATREKYEHTIGNTGSDAFKEAKRQGKPIDTVETVFEKKYGAAVKEAKDKKYAAANKKFKSILKGEK